MAEPIIGKGDEFSPTRLTPMAASTAKYELLDFGDGRKLELFGPIVLNRPSPTAEGARKARPELWGDAVARFEGRTGDGKWIPQHEGWIPDDWQVEFDAGAPIRLGLDALPSGQVGVFPEQRENWKWIGREAAKSIPLAMTRREARRTQRSAPANPRSAPPSLRVAANGTMRVLNLFAYTGASTLAAAAAGADVVHVDAARSVVDRARQNAALSGLAERPIRWIVEDAVKFCRREVKRGNHYDAVILDPPTYGHGPKGEPWKIGEHLLPLLRLCGELTAERRAFVLVTCHSPGIGPAELSAYLSEGIFGHCGEPPRAGELFLETADGRRLTSGIFARWPA
ncbi:MAG TPA: class I SAM-dependent methyltransferase [Lacipirellulaceae bacterium]|nr:class I SAM-dependent methyltransferase [Lacipirellulaceae bacterium]